jgi:hypothetical protein
MPVQIAMAAAILRLVIIQTTLYLRLVDPKPVPYGVVLKNVHSNRSLTSHDKQE